MKEGDFNTQLQQHQEEQLASSNRLGAERFFRFIDQAIDKTSPTDDFDSAYLTADEREKVKAVLESNAIIGHLSKTTPLDEETQIKVVRERISDPIKRTRGWGAVQRIEVKYGRGSTTIISLITSPKEST